MHSNTDCRSRLALCLVLIFAATTPATAKTPKNFSVAKKEIYEVYRQAGIDTTFYCGCQFSRHRVDLAGCGYRIRPGKGKRAPSRAATARAKRTEIEHVVPASHIGSRLACWKEAKRKGVSARKHCQKTDPLFRAAYTDLVNLRVAIGQINGDRSSHRFGQVGRIDGQYGRCEMKIDFKHKVAEPPDAVKGDVARITWYYMDRYGYQVGSRLRRLLPIWHRLDPVDQDECRLNRTIRRAQGHGNPYVERFCNP